MFPVKSLDMQWGDVTKVQETPQLKVFLHPREDALKAVLLILLLLLWPNVFWKPKELNTSAVLQNVQQYRHKWRWLLLTTCRQILTYRRLRVTFSVAHWGLWHLVQPGLKTKHTQNYYSCNCPHILKLKLALGSMWIWFGSEWKGNWLYFHHRTYQRSPDLPAAVCCGWMIVLSLSFRGVAGGSHWKSSFEEVMPKFLTHTHTHTHTLKKKIKILH